MKCHSLFVCLISMLSFFPGKHRPCHLSLHFVITPGLTHQMQTTSQKFRCTFSFDPFSFMSVTIYIDSHLRDQNNEQMKHIQHYVVNKEVWHNSRSYTLQFLQNSHSLYKNLELFKQFLLNCIYLAHKFDILACIYNVERNKEKTETSDH